MLRKALQQIGKPGETLRQALRIIQPVDAQDQGALAQALHQALDLRAGGGAAGRQGEGVGIDADRMHRSVGLDAIAGERLVEEPRILRPSAGRSRHRR